VADSSADTEADAARRHLEQALTHLGAPQHANVTALVRQALAGLTRHPDHGLRPDELNASNDL
jgi:hypothetical protein